MIFDTMPRMSTSERAIPYIHRKILLIRVLEWSTRHKISERRLGREAREFLLWNFADVTSASKRRIAVAHFHLFSLL